MGGGTAHSSGVTFESPNSCPTPRLHRATPQISDPPVFSWSQAPYILVEDLRGPHTVTSSGLVKGPFSRAPGVGGHRSDGVFNLYHTCS